MQSRTLKTMVITGLLAVCAAVLALGIFANPRTSEAEEPDVSVAVYRLYNHWDGAHLITADSAERDRLVAYGYTDEGIAFKTPQTGQPIYRLYNDFNGDHHYTTDESERAILLLNGWSDEGVGFYASPVETEFAVYRFWNSHMTAYGGRGSHLWTLDRQEYDSAVAAGCTAEGITWYATGPAEPKAPTDPVGIHGALRVEGTSLVDQHGAPVQLRGMSTHGLSFAENGVRFSDYVSEATFRTLRDDWGANCVRLAMYTADYNGYCTGGDQNWLKDVVSNGVKCAKDLGLYVIVDWHVLLENSPTVYQEQAKDFFRTLSDEFRNYDNVLYEICNEPNGWADWNTVKGYAEQIIPIIRANDPDAVVIVGSPEWSQRIDLAAADPLTGAVGQNVLYSLHFYAATHTQWLRDRMNAALDAGLPIFISEFGTCDASGNGGNNFYEAQQWIDLANARNVSWMNWSLCNKYETSAAIWGWTAKLSDWQPWELTESGNWVRNAMRAAAGL